jgi:hypothetical protein
VLLRHRVSVLVVVIGVVATVGVFTFAKPEYRGPGSGAHDVKPLAYVHLPVRGWSWEDGLPGYRFGHDESRWNASRLLWADLAPLRYAARRSHVDPQSLRVLDDGRLAPRARPFVLVSGRGAGGETCIGAQPGDGPARFVCPPELRDDLAILVVSARPRFATGDYPIYLDGVVSARVTKATLATRGAVETFVRGGKRWTRPEGPEIVYDRATWLGNWGTLMSYRGQPVPWNATLDLYGASGKLASVRLRFTKPGAYVYCASAFAGSAGDCAQRRS